MTSDGASSSDEYVIVEVADRSVGEDGEADLPPPPPPKNGARPSQKREEMDSEEEESD
jgi:hypothetical protein